MNHPSAMQLHRVQYTFLLGLVRWRGRKTLLNPSSLLIVTGGRHNVAEATSGD